ncbi:DUF4249 domain-containing protein [Flavobacterium psychrotrophum]|uniref:DUF4249 domain-containing protein n=1 Tax=Flavobacterium psychrotrophum TaxID=2294119 RepID=UPI000E324911|nr:DUF4249 domain-containing protein [Flavobacterium psychrotrophum]
MKKIFYIALMISSLFLTGCEEVVDVDLETAAPRLVIDASINWEKETPGTVQTIKLTTTTGYYNTEIPVVSNATVFITNSRGFVYNFTETPGTGSYVCANFLPESGQTYVLTVINDGQTYTATETLYDVPNVTHIQQTDNGGFLGEDKEVRFFFNDPADEENYYMVRYDTDVIPFPEYDVMEDRFTNGNEMFNYFSHEDLKTGDKLDIKLYGISKQYYNYMAKLLDVAGGSGGGPFTTPPATVRGNVVNQTDESNYALGYFRLSQVYQFTYPVN